MSIRKINKCVRSMTIDKMKSEDKKYKIFSNHKNIEYCKK